MALSSINYDGARQVWFYLKENRSVRMQGAHQNVEIDFYSPTRPSVVDLVEMFERDKGKPNIHAFSIEHLRNKVKDWKVSGLR